MPPKKSYADMFGMRGSAASEEAKTVGSAGQRAPVAGRSGSQPAPAAKTASNSRPVPPAAKAASSSDMKQSARGTKRGGGGGGDGAGEAKAAPKQQQGRANASVAKNAAQNASAGPQAAKKSGSAEVSDGSGGAAGSSAQGGSRGSQGNRSGGGRSSRNGSQKNGAGGSRSRGRGRGRGGRGRGGRGRGRRQTKGGRFGNRGGVGGGNGSGAGYAGAPFRGGSGPYSGVGGAGRGGFPPGGSIYAYVPQYGGYAPISGTNGLVIGMQGMSMQPGSRPPPRRGRGRGGRGRGGGFSAGRVIGGLPVGGVGPPVAYPQPPPGYYAVPFFGPGMGMPQQVVTPAYLQQFTIARALGEGASPVFSIDVECVATGVRHDARAVAQIALVDEFEKVLCNIHVKPDEPIVSYLPALTGLDKKTIDESGIPQSEAVARVKALLPKSAILVGQNIHKDVQWLGLQDGKDFQGMRDLGQLWRVRNENFGGKFTYFSLQHEGKALLNLEQGEPHSPVKDALMSIRLYNLFRNLEAFPDIKRDADKLLLAMEKKPSFASKNPVYDKVCMGVRKVCKCGAPFLY